MQICKKSHKTSYYINIPIKLALGVFIIRSDRGMVNWRRLAHTQKNYKQIYDHIWLFMQTDSFFSFSFVSAWLLLLES